MSTIDKGILIFNEWFEAMNELPGTDFKKLLLAIRDYQLYGTEPPQFKGKSKLVAALIFPCIARRVALSRAGKLGAAVTNQRLYSEPDNTYFDGGYDGGYGGSYDDGYVDG